MALTSLVVCADAPTVAVLGRILSKLGIQVETCGDRAGALALVGAQGFDALVVDWV